MHRPLATIVMPRKVIRLFKRNSIRFVLMGTYGINGYRDQAQSSRDVDVLVWSRDHVTATRVIRDEYPNLVVHDSKDVTRFVDPHDGLAAIDLWRPTSGGMKVVFANAVAVGESHAIPNLEMALAMKFFGMISIKQEMSRRYLHAGDFYNMVKANLENVNEIKTKELADKVCFGGGAKILGLLDAIKAGRPIQI